MPKIGLVFGTFDPLHYGHIRLLKRASCNCDILYACTESDDIIRENKNREPFTSEEERLEDLKGIKYIKEAFIRNKDFTRDDVVNKVKPDILFLGGDWIGKKWEGEKYGIKIMYLPRTEGISSTELRK